jgi:copper/silver efflux system protein
VWIAFVVEALSAFRDALEGWRDEAGEIPPRGIVLQVIVYTEYSGQAPQVVEDQVTYPLTTAMLSVPKARVVRGFSFFGVSFVYVIFEDGTDLYWARSRVLEYLSSASRRLPAGVAPSLGPDATGVGWVYQYVIRSAQKNLAELRTIQDWYIRYGIAKGEGVAEVASVGGFVKQYSVVIDPRRLQALGIPLAKIREALRTQSAMSRSHCPRAVLAQTRSADAHRISGD